MIYILYPQTGLQQVATPTHRDTEEVFHQTLIGKLVHKGRK